MAVEVGADAIILDDRPARRAADAAGLSVVGTIGLLLESKREGLLATVRPELDKLLETSFFLTHQLRDQVLRMAGEATDLTTRGIAYSEMTQAISRSGEDHATKARPPTASARPATDDIEWLSAPLAACLTRA